MSTKWLVKIISNVLFLFFPPKIKTIFVHGNLVGNKPGQPERLNEKCVVQGTFVIATIVYGFLFIYIGLREFYIGLLPPFDLLLIEVV